MFDHVMCRISRLPYDECSMEEHPPDGCIAVDLEHYPCVGQDLVEDFPELAAAVRDLGKSRDLVRREPHALVRQEQARAALNSPRLRKVMESISDFVRREVITDVCVVCGTAEELPSGDCRRCSELEAESTLCGCGHGDRRTCECESDMDRHDPRRC